MASPFIEQRLIPAAASTRRRSLARLVTAVVVTVFTISGLGFIVGPPEIAANIRHLGYPDYFRELLGVAKLLGAAALILPTPTRQLREWAYAGFAFTCVAALVSHLASGDPVLRAIPAAVVLALVSTSYVLRRQMEAS